MFTLARNIILSNKHIVFIALRATFKHFFMHDYASLNTTGHYPALQFVLKNIAKIILKKFKDLGILALTTITTEEI
ncbi:MAG: hypothetical protein KAS93_07330 [Gammaproteobacteria bacterium]|nr:hypothetical protein [Gammaproteobacteria bacterium]